jgi:hypothetical protein
MMSPLNSLPIFGTTGMIFRRYVSSLLFAASLLFSTAAASAGTYYVDYSNGSDANNGASKSTPWKRCPGMSGFSAGYSHQAGDRFIFKGGVTWTDPIYISYNGSSGSADYYGVDKTWYSGAAWARPKIDRNYGGDRCIDLGSHSYVTIDNFELCHVSGSTSGGDGPGIVYSAGTPTNITVSNCYIHGWAWTGSSDGGHGGLIMANAVWAGNDTNVIDSCEIENSAANNGSANHVEYNGDMVRCWGTIKNSHLHHNCSAVLFCLDFNGNELDHINGGSFDSNAHENGVYLDVTTMGWVPWVLGASKTGYIRNSKFHDVAGGANMAYPNPRFSTIYIYNNVFYGGVSAQRCIDPDPYSYIFNVPGQTTSGECYIYNNTLAPSDGGVPFHFGNRWSVNTSTTHQDRLSKVVIQNNQYIGNSGINSDLSGSNTAQTIVNDHNLTQSPAAASAQGYTLANLYAPSSGGPTVDAGTSSPSFLFNTDIKGASRPAGSAWDIGAYEFGGVGAPPTPTPAPSATPAPTATPAPSPIATPTPGQPLGLVFDSTAGLISSPFVSNGNAVSQSVQTVDPTQAGRAVYTFNAAASGDYVVAASVNAPNEGSNSFFLNIDAEPTAPAAIWDVPVTSGFEQRIASWRGAGTDTTDQFQPKIFTLSAGTHQLVILGREAGTVLGQITIAKVPAPPSNVRVVGP